MRIPTGGPVSHAGRAAAVGTTDRLAVDGVPDDYVSCRIFTLDAVFRFVVLLAACSTAEHHTCNKERKCYEHTLHQRISVACWVSARHGGEEGESRVPRSTDIEAGHSDCDLTDDMNDIACGRFQYGY